MSADNGIYILETLRKGFEKGTYEYRVKELGAIDNLCYDAIAPNPVRPSGKYHSVSEFRPEDKEHVAYQESYRAKYYSKNPDVLIANARDMWKDCTVFTNKANALNSATSLEKVINEQGYPLEYGISFIRIDRVF